MTSAVGAVTAVAQNIFGSDPCHDGGDCRYRVYRGHEAIGVPMTLACDCGMVKSRTTLDKIKIVQQQRLLRRTIIAI